MVEAKKEKHEIRVEPPSSAGPKQSLFKNNSAPDFYGQNLHQTNSLPAGDYDSNSALNGTPQGAI